MTENAGHLGLPTPEKLKAVLSQLHDKLPDGGSNVGGNDAGENGGDTEQKSE